MSVIHEAADPKVTKMTIYNLMKGDVMAVPGTIPQCKEGRLWGANEDVIIV